MNSKTQINLSQMVVHGRRSSRTIESKSYGEGYNKSFIEYFAPAREKGTKMLKLGKRLWIYSPATDRTIQLSGHMLKQSVMGSDLSYEDMMDDRKLSEMYTAEYLGDEELGARKVWVVYLLAKVPDASYPSRKVWIDQTHFVPLKQELYAKSGKLLKRVLFSDVRQVSGRWYPHRINYKDMLKNGKGTDFIIKEIQFNPEIPESIFSKAKLRK
ncbi:MAG: outer membrane lipoprotein-sorting protein [Cytophagales bacterium]|nr:outer membrane lipoprotein-sorting protein [Cytophagales bacterium]